MRGYNLMHWYFTGCCDTMHNDILHNDTQQKGLFVTISRGNTQHSSKLMECHYAEFHILFIVMLIVIMLSVIMINVIMLSTVEPYSSSLHFKNTFFATKCFKSFYFKG